MFTIYDMNNHSRRNFERGQSVSTIYHMINQDPNPVILVWDGPFGNQQRRRLFPGYKGKRKGMMEDMRASQELLRELLKLTRHTTILVPEFEADDVIAAIVRQLGSEPVHIRSNDMDFAQFPNVKLDREKIPCEPEWVRLYKVTVGDDSDSIPGIKGFGEGSWPKLDKPGFQAFLNGLGNAPALDGLGFSKAQLSWLEEPENLELIRTFYQIVGFLDVPSDLISKGTTPGRPNPAAANEILRQYLLP
ncbi:hypothetical protein [Inquilinus limosus]|uniref:5'-3' exonuclease domain-containing protein n=1 Tax=Inquilinus limosus MP06 TaxID=1398085 RepID=A0A0A0DDX2_9PROT|nr:hypothetical protein [Inquilinus limosus]KGM36098.1 hypothetical protein P409_00155 [Inquilinus limosus MP06]